MTPIETLQSFIAARGWTFAKTMPQWPHEYTVRQGPEDTEFEAAALLIRENGYKERWGSYNHTYFNVDGWKYWTMGNPLPVTKIINRARL